MIQVELAVARRTILLLLFFVLFRFVLILTKMARKPKASAHTEHRNGILGHRGCTGMGAIARLALDEIRNRSNRTHGGIHQRHVISLSRAGLLSVLLMEDVHLAGTRGGHGAGITAAGGGPIDLLEHVLGIQHPWVNAGGIQIILAHQEDLGRLRSRRVGLDGLDRLEELLDHPEVAGVVLRSVDLGNERSAPLQVFRGALEGVEGNLVLLVGIAVVTGTDVGRTVA
mmetsp:Transcript_26839/g.77393  ORF Transcript_26839/g.77393 Transcript_26839/m.77393 type:complete len:227 (+) Transcript_26839:2203-2883(+)